MRRVSGTASPGHFAFPLGVEVSRPSVPHENTRRVYTLPATPGDWRSSRNTRADIRRLLREDGVFTPPLQQPEPPPRKLDRLAELERRVAALERRLQFDDGSNPRGSTSPRGAGRTVS